MLFSIQSFKRGAIAVALLSAITAAALAQTPPELARYGGQYVYDGKPDEGIAIVEKAVDKAMVDQNMVARAFTKKMLASNFARVVVIEVQPGKIGLKVGELDKVTQDIGKTETVKGKDGKSGRLSYRFEDGAIVSTWLGDDMTIRTVFTLGKDAKSLEREVKVTSGQLGKPLMYRLKYKRQ